VCAIALLVIPSGALASGDTIDAAAGMPFSGVVDNFPSCTAATASINWGDGSTPTAGSVDPSTGAVSGSHTYGAQGTYNGTVTLTGGNCAAGAPTQDTFTANVKPAPAFKQCPAIDKDFGCQFLITASNSGTKVQQDGNQIAVDNGGDDALIGIQNNSTGPISSIPLHVANSGLFGFEADGLCDPGSPPVPSGCQPTSGSAPSGSCSAGNNSCTFPAPPGQPAGHTEPGNLSGSTQNGYEGPTTWFSNVSTDQNSGQVNFAPALQPGQSTYFSLEEPPINTSLNVGAQPIGGLSSRPTVTSTGAKFSGLVNPNGSTTTAYFQYGLDKRYGGGLAGQFVNKTKPQVVGGDFSGHFVSATVSGLVPNALYHVRLVATNGSGTTFGTDTTFTTGKLANPGAPSVGKTFNISLAGGLVLVKVHGKFIPLTQLRQFPTNTQIDALKGSLKLITSTGQKKKTQTANFTGGIFKITQTRFGADKGLTILTLVEGAFKGAPTYAKCPKAAGDGATAHAALSRRVQQTLRGSDKHGRFRTVGRYAAATVRGTNWGTRDRCDGTLTVVNSGTVSVTDFTHHKTLNLHAGQQYLATKKK
jgi:hypothetical protein